MLRHCWGANEISCYWLSVTHPLDDHIWLVIVMFTPFCPLFTSSYAYMYSRSLRRCEAMNREKLVSPETSYSLVLRAAIFLHTVCAPRLGVSNQETQPMRPRWEVNIQRHLFAPCVILSLGLFLELYCTFVMHCRALRCLLTWNSPETFVILTADKY